MNAEGAAGVAEGAGGVAAGATAPGRCRVRHAVAWRRRPVSLDQDAVAVALLLTERRRDR